MKEYELIVTMEENVASGGFGERVSEFLRKMGYDKGIVTICLPNDFICHGNVKAVEERLGFDAKSFANRILEHLLG